MGARRTTFGKAQRERDKRAKAAAKRERRTSQGNDREQEPAAPEVEPEDQQSVLSELAGLHQRHADGELDLEEFEARRDELRARLHIT